MSEDNLWYKDATIYQTHVRAYLDSNADGIGDFRGLTAKLDYIRDLGVSAIWVLPFYPSPLRDDGYDIADYTSVHPDYGTLADFRQFLRGAHKRGIRVITELVLNHTSDQHPWFQRARRSAPGTSERNFYIWSNTPDRYKDVRIIFEDFETSNWSFDPVAGAHFWHRFYHHQPDLNYDNPEVVRAIYRIMDFWLGMGVDGLRLDAVPYLFKREGTNCENLPETHQLLRDIRQHVDAKFGGRMLLAEANMWPEDAAAYFGEGNECHMAFHFPVMPRLFMAVRMEDRHPIIDIMEQTPNIPDTCQWAVFLRNHDELTLEMVTDEERDYMYRVYAHDPRARLNLGIRRRLAPLLGNARRRIELLNGLLLSLPGTPVVYYGDEIGMGDNIYLGDRNGVRTPMQWTSDRNAGFSSANAQKLYLPVIIDPEYHYEAINVAAQLDNPSSMLWWMRRLIAMRKRFRAFARGTLRFLSPENRKVLAFLRCYRGEQVLVVANLSRFTQYVELDLSDFKGYRPVEMFGHTQFPPIGDLPYLLSLGPHNFYWFVVEPAAVQGSGLAATFESARIEAGEDWSTILIGDRRSLLEQRLPAWLRTHGWFCSRGRTVAAVEIVDSIPLGNHELRAAMVLVRVRYTEGDPDIYLLPLTYAVGERAVQLQQSAPQEVISSLVTRDGEGILTDALLDGNVCTVLLESLARGRQFKGKAGIITATPAHAPREATGAKALSLEPSLLRTGGNNTLISYGKQFVLKLYRRVDEGTNPGLEIGTFLTEKVPFPHTPSVAGGLEYRSQQGEPMTLAVLQAYIPNQGNAWRYTMDVLERYFERMASRAPDANFPVTPVRMPVEVAGEEIPEIARELIGTYLESARLIGRRTAELHLALTAATEDSDFIPEPFTRAYQRSIHQSMRNQADQVLELLKKCLGALSEDARARGAEVLRRREEVIAHFRPLLNGQISALRSRIHGNYHLGKILCTGKDFVVIDFQGQPLRSVGARRIKRSPLYDVAGMLRSFHYATRSALEHYVRAGAVSDDHKAKLKLSADFWVFWVEVVFLEAYMRGVGERRLVPKDHSALGLLLNIYRMDNLIGDLGEKLSCRPESAAMPLDEILHVLGNP